MFVKDKTCNDDEALTLKFAISTQAVPARPHTSSSSLTVSGGLTAAHAVDSAACTAARARPSRKRPSSRLRPQRKTPSGFTV